jgi:transglutaminase-like putative cysteine protease
MSVLVALQHVTRYRYNRPISLGPQIIRLRPAPHCRTAIRAYSLKVEPAQHFVNWQQDPNGNWLARFVFPERTTEFSITVDLLADMSVINPFDFFVDPAATNFPFAYPAEFDEELAPYHSRETPGLLLAEYLKSISREPQNIVDFLVALNQRLQREIRYLVRLDPGVQAPEETLKLASGSCRDTAWLLVHILRHLGLAARFVSGYLIQLVPDLKALDGPAGSTADFTDLHAWTEVYIPGAGWVGLDPTSGLLTGEGHLPLAATPHYRAAAPISGGVEAADVEFSFAMKIDRVDEKPRVTFPFSDEHWNALDALGDRIEADLVAQDVRLTMGGEPTFVSIDDYQTAEWNTAAVGPTKRILADQLIRRLRDRFAPGGLIHHGQGKWYPGEPLPRWAFSLFWRTDGKPLWQDEALIATEKPLKAASVNDAHWFTESLAGRLGIATNHVMPAFEDPAEC